MNKPKNSKRSKFAYIFGHQPLAQYNKFKEKIGESAKEYAVFLRERLRSQGPDAAQIPHLDRVGIVLWLMTIKPEGGQWKRTAYDLAWEAEVNRIANLPRTPRIHAAISLAKRFQDAYAIHQAEKLGRIYGLPAIHIRTIEDLKQRRYALVQLKLASAWNAPLSLDPLLIQKVETVNGKTVITLTKQIEVKESEAEVEEQMGVVYREAMEIKEFLKASDMERQFAIKKLKKKKKKLGPRRPKKNPELPKGVSKNVNTYRATYKNHYIGTFRTIEAAVQAIADLKASSSDTCSSRSVLKPDATSSSETSVP